MGKHGTKRWLQEGQADKIDAYWGSKADWNPLHSADELREYPKEVTELDV